jgi:multidrug efflux pump subunit AcrA (membrane-fusion protein)
MGAKVTFYEQGAEVPKERSVVTVPKAAVVNQGGNTVVFMVKGEKAAVQSVTVGPEEAGYVTILNGLDGGESVIVSGQSALKDGEKIAVRR